MNELTCFLPYPPSMEELSRHGQKLRIVRAISLLTGGVNVGKSPCGGWVVQEEEIIHCE